MSKRSIRKNRHRPDFVSSKEQKQIQKNLDLASKNTNHKSTPNLVLEDQKNANQNNQDIQETKQHHHIHGEGCRH